MKKLKRLFLYTTTFLLVSFGSLAVVFYSCPGMVEQYYLDVAYRDANLEVKQLEVQGEVFEYAEGGSGETVVLIHGFQGDKRIWIPYVKKLQGQYNFIIVDLPGHGGTSAAKNLDYDLYSVASYIDRFIEAKGLKKFHLGGISMGGGVAAVYATLHLEKLQSLLLINPFGIQTLEKSAFEKEIEKGRNLFFPENLEELDDLITFICGKPSTLAKVFKNHMLAKMKEKQAFYRKVFYQLINSKPLENFLPSIDLDTLVLIGGNDQILHPSSVKMFEDLLPKANVQLFPSGAHVFGGQVFDQAIESISKFLHNR